MLFLTMAKKKSAAYVFHKLSIKNLCDRVPLYLIGKPKAFPEYKYASHGILMRDSDTDEIYLEIPYKTGKGRFWQTDL